MNKLLLCLILAPVAALADAPPVLTIGACVAQADGSSVCPVKVPASPPAPAAAPTYALVAREGGSFTLLESQMVRYGAADKWVEKGIAAGVATACSNDTFGDPIFGTVKRCEVRGGPAIELTPAPTAAMPAAVDHSMMGVTIDPALLAAVAPAAGSSAPRVKTTWHRKDNWGADCAPNTDDCFVFDAEKPNPNTDIGDFREPTSFAKFDNIDPIVFAGQPEAKSHPHTFMGATNCITASTTPESLVAPGCASTSAGGSLNLTSYWFPTAVDTRTGQPLRPNDGLIYYKDSYDFDIHDLVELMPAGLRVVSGNAKNTDPAQASGRFNCVAPDGTQGPTANTIPGALVGGLCKTGGSLHFGIAFPYCWDGVNLDSPNHNSQMAWPETYIAIKQADGKIVESTQGTPGSYYGKRCPATHPRVLPTISYSFSFPITDDHLVENIRFASDVPGSEAGSSFHADYYMGWDRATGQRWVDNCLRKNVDCHAWLLGDGYTLY